MSPYGHSVRPLLRSFREYIAHGAIPSGTISTINYLTIAIRRNRVICNHDPPGHYFCSRIRYTRYTRTPKRVCCIRPTTQYVVVLKSHLVYTREVLISAIRLINNFTLAARIHLHPHPMYTRGVICQKGALLCAGSIEKELF